MRGFYRVKQVESWLGITYKTIKKYIALGVLPELERPYPLNSRFVGYSEETMARIRNSWVSSNSTKS